MWVLLGPPQLTSPRKAWSSQWAQNVRSKPELNADNLYLNVWQNVVHWRREWKTASVFLPWEPHEQYESQNDRILKEELPRSVGAHCATGDQWRNNSRKNEGMEPKQRQYPAVDGTGDRSVVWCCKEQCCIGTWNVRSMNQGKSEVVKQEMTRVNVNILEISN